MGSVPNTVPLCRRATQADREHRDRFPTEKEVDSQSAVFLEIVWARAASSGGEIRSGSALVPKTMSRQPGQEGSVRLLLCY